MLRHISKIVFCLLLFAPAVLADPIQITGTPITVINGPSTFQRVVTEPFVITGNDFTANINIVTAGFCYLSDSALRPI